MKQIHMHRFDPTRSWPTFLAVGGVFLTFAFVLLMPRSSSDVTGPGLLLFWAVHIFGALVLLESAQLFLARFAAFNRINPWVQTTLAGILGATIFTPLALLLDSAFGLVEEVEERFAPLSQQLLSEFAGLAPIVMLVWIALNATRMLRLEIKPAAASKTGSSLPVFWDRVPVALGTDLTALSAELHYLRVYTALGDALILYPFGKALMDVTARDGLQIHRSHWVALPHVAKIVPLGQRGLCTMDTGLELPVSRSYRAALKSAFAATQQGRSLRA